VRGKRQAGGKRQARGSGCQRCVMTGFPCVTELVRSMAQTDRFLALVFLLSGVVLLSRRRAPRAAAGSRMEHLIQGERNGQGQRERERERENLSIVDPRITRRPKQSRGAQWIIQHRAILFLLSAIGATFGWMWCVVGSATWIGFMLFRKSRKYAHQRKTLAGGLVDLVEEMARQLRGGLGVTTALLQAIANSSDDLQQVLEPVVASLTIGTPASVAVTALGSQHNNGDLHSLATLLGASEQLGGVRPDALDGLTTMMRERTTAGADVATQAAQARVSAIVLGCAPIVFCGVLVLSDGRSSAFLLHSPIGLGCAVVGLVLDGIGGVWMSTVTRRAMA
jgi:Flp pilus assembly protein TadB